MEVNQTAGEIAAFYQRIFFPSATVLCVIALIGFYGHCRLITATFRFKYLHNPCNILIALLAIGDFGHQLAQIPYAFLIFSGITFISQRSCYWIQLIPAVCMQHTIINIICLGLDRMYCITWPFGYRKICASRRSQTIYLLLVNVLPVVFSTGLAVFAYIEMEKDPEKETLCLIAAFFSGESQEVWAALTALFTGCAVVIYVVIWIIVWKKAHVINTIKNTLKPLTIILCLTFFGWFIGMGIVTYISKREDLPMNLRVGYISYAGISINASIAANYFVYKYFSSDYKKAFNNLFKAKTDSQAGSRGPPSHTNNTVNPSSHN